MDGVFGDLYPGPFNYMVSSEISVFCLLRMSGSSFRSLKTFISCVQRTFSGSMGYLTISMKKTPVLLQNICFQMSYSFIFLNID